MRCSVIRFATLFLLLMVACAPKRVTTPVRAVGCTTTGVATPVRVWSLPEGCVSRFRTDEYGRANNQEPRMIKGTDELRAHVECRPQHEPDYDFSVEWLAMFRLASQGGSFNTLVVEDDGKTVTLVVESTSYCGGVPPRTNVETFFYRVPQRTCALATKIVPANQPPCSPDIP